MSANGRNFREAAPRLGKKLEGSDRVSCMHRPSASGANAGSVVNLLRGQHMAYILTEESERRDVGGEGGEEWESAATFDAEMCPTAVTLNWLEERSAASPARRARDYYMIEWRGPLASINIKVVCDVGSEAARDRVEEEGIITIRNKFAVS